MRALPLLGAVLLAGCLSGPAALGDARAPEAGSDAPRARVEYPAELTACEHADLYLPVPVSAVAPHVPDDFEVAVGGVTPAALAFVGLLRCERFAADDLSGRGDFAWLDVAVVPRSDALLSPDADIHLLRLEHYVLPGALADMQARLGDAHVVADRIDVDLSLLGAGFTIAAGDVALAARPAAAGAAPTAPFAGMSIREFGFADGGYSFVDITVAPREPVMGGVPAKLEASPGSLAYRILGDAAVGSLVTAAFDFTDGRIGFIPAP